MAKLSALQQSINDHDDAVDQWRKRLRCCLKMSGRHFEHCFSLPTLPNIRTFHHELMYFRLADSF